MMNGYYMFEDEISFYCPHEYPRKALRLRLPSLSESLPEFRSHMILEMFVC